MTTGQQPSRERALNKTFDPPTKDHPVTVVRTLRALTTLSNDPARRKRFFERLQESETDIDYSELLLASGVIGQEQALHLQKHWFGKGPNSSGVWFPGDQPIKRKFRDNMTEGFRLSVSQNKPVVVYWSVPSEHVYVTLDDTETEIILFRFTPTPPAPRGPFPER